MFYVTSTTGHTKSESLIIGSLIARTKLPQLRRDHQRQTRIKTQRINQHNIHHLSITISYFDKDIFIYL